MLTDEDRDWIRAQVRALPPADEDTLDEVALILARARARRALEARHEAGGAA